MWNWQGYRQMSYFLIGILLVFGLTVPVAGQSADTDFAVDGATNEVILGIDPQLSDEYTLSAPVYNVQGNSEDGAQVEPPQPGLLWLYVLLVAIIATCGLAILLLLKSGPIYSRSGSSSREEESTQYETLPVGSEADQSITDTMEVSVDYMTANAAAGNGAFELADGPELLDQGTANRPPGVLAYLIVKHLTDEEQKYHLFESTASIGRGKDVYIMLLDNKVSRHHADITYKDGEYIFVDNQPSNPSHINGQIYSGAHVIRDNDEFILGETRILFKRV